MAKKRGQPTLLTGLALQLEKYIVRGTDQPKLEAFSFNELQAAYVEVTNRHPKLASPDDITDAGLRYEAIGHALDRLSGELFIHTPPSTWVMEDGVGTGRRIGGSHLRAQIEYHGGYPK